MGNLELLEVENHIWEPVFIQALGVVRGSFCRGVLFGEELKKSYTLLCRVMIAVPVLINRAYAPASLGVQGLSFRIENSELFSR